MQREINAFQRQNTHKESHKRVVQRSEQKKDPTYDAGRGISSSELQTRLIQAPGPAPAGKYPKFSYF